MSRSSLMIWMASRGVSPSAKCNTPLTNSSALIELGELVLLLDDPGGIWAILDCGATRILIGITMAEYLTYDMMGEA